MNLKWRRRASQTRREHFSSCSSCEESWRRSRSLTVRDSHPRCEVAQPHSDGDSHCWWTYVSRSRRLRGHADSLSSELARTFAAKRTSRMKTKRRTRTRTRSPHDISSGQTWRRGCCCYLCNYLPERSSRRRGRRRLRYRRSHLN